MPSQAHEELVANLIASGAGRVPEVFPPPEQFHQIREAERSLPVFYPEGASFEEIELGGLSALRVRDKGHPSRRLILYLHGGGYLFLSPKTCAGAMAALARICEAECVGLNYRLAPEAPFPAAVDDVVSAYSALLADGNRPEDMWFAGDSAGGGLAIAGLLACAERGMMQPAGAIVFSPWTDLAVTGATVDMVDDPVVSGAGLRAMAALYLNGADTRTPLAAPLYADPAALARLPPILVQVGGREALLDDSRRFVKAAQRAGAEVTLREYPGVIHMWMVTAPDLPESVEAFELAGDFVRRTRSSKA